MNKYLLRLNSKRCIGCHACEVLCKLNKGLPPGPMLCEIRHEPLKVLRGVARTEFRFRSCHQCEDPLCVASCPTGAMRKRDEDGIVFVEPEKCTGCMICGKACPWEIPQLNPVNGKAVKCDYCLERLDAGLKPACVTGCVGRALRIFRLESV